MTRKVNPPKSRSRAVTPSPNTAKPACGAPSTSTCGLRGLAKGQSHPDIRTQHRQTYRGRLPHSSLDLLSSRSVPASRHQNRYKGQPWPSRSTLRRCGDSGDVFSPATDPVMRYKKQVTSSQWVKVYESNEQGMALYQEGGCSSLWALVGQVATSLVKGLACKTVKRLHQIY